MVEHKMPLMVLGSCLLFSQMTAATNRIDLDKSLAPNSPNSESGEKTFLSLKESWTKDFIKERMSAFENPDRHYAVSTGRRPVGSKTFALGTNNRIFHDSNLHKGFLSTVLAAYANHWTLVTSPEDWWFTIVQRVATAIDSNSEKPSVRQHFVSHQGKKELLVYFDRGLYTSNHTSFFQQMTNQVSENIKDPAYVANMRPDFSTTSNVHTIIGNIAIMSSLQEFFTYTGGILCGIPALEMKGTEADWRKLVTKLSDLRERLGPVTDDIGLSNSWWSGVREVLEQLVATYTGGDTRDWWRQVIDRKEEHIGCGAVEVTWTGWFVQKFLGQDLEDVPSGLVSVPLNIEQGEYREKSALVAGIAGFTLDQEQFKVEAEHVWNLMLEPDSRFRRS